MNYRCCLCSVYITKADGDALRLTFNSLWKSVDDLDPSEQMWAHRRCVQEKIEPLLDNPLDTEVLPIQTLRIVR